MKKELQELGKGPEVNIYLESRRATFKKVPKWKIPSHDGIHRFRF